jgi:peptide/nickel transport system permease protein
MEITMAVLGLSDLQVPTIGTMIYWANYYQSLLARRWWWLATPIIITVLIVVAFYLLSTALSTYLDPRTRLKNLVVKETVAS